MLPVPSMAESTKVRLVRCPKCQNLLPELHDFSVYRCGGCGAVLRAKSRNLERDCSSDKSVVEKLGRASANSASSSDKGLDLSDASDADTKYKAGSLRCRRSDPRKGVLDFDDGSVNESNFTSDKWVAENGEAAMSSSEGEFNNAFVKRHQDLDLNPGFPGGKQSVRHMSDLRNMSREDINMERFRRNPRTFRAGERFPTSHHSEEGPSNYDSDSSYSYRGPLMNREDHSGANRDLSQLDHAELLRQIDELKARLQSCNVADKPKEEIPFRQRMAPLDTYEGADSWFPNGSVGPSRSNNPTAGSAFYDNSPDTFHYPPGHDRTGHGLYPMHHPKNVPGYGDPFGSHVLRGTRDQFASEYQTQAPHSYFSGQHIERKRVPYMPHPRSSLLHNSSCSCYHCHEKHHQVLASVASTAFSNNRFPDSRNNQVLYHFENPGISGQRVHNLRSEMAPSENLHGKQVHDRWLGDVSFEMSDSEQFHHRLVIASGHHLCYPVVGGAPFLTCSNCFELLNLPRKLKLQGKAEHKLRCGACSTIMKVAIINKKFVFLDNLEANTVPTDVDGSTEVEKKNFHDNVDRITADLSSDDYDKSAYDFQSRDMAPVPQLKGQDLNKVEPQEMHRFLSSSSSTSENGNSLDDLTASREALNPFEQRIKNVLSSSPHASQLQDHSGYSSDDPSLNRFGKGNRSHQSDQEQVLSSKVTTRHLKEASVVTEIDVAYDEFLNTGGSQDSIDANRENDQCKKTKGSDFFLSNIIKKSFKDLSRCDDTEEGGESYISVNGQPISELDVKKAEKLAGPIKPGEYWYDFRAGFWGVMYGPCLGIIPPFIEKFNYPIPENCAGGNTGVVVNGRELHQKDLDLLASRGLPTDRGRSYIVEISGSVLDEDSGKELDGLGKLAPTIEKVKHGFGMKPPRAAE